MSSRIGWAWDDLSSTQLRQLASSVQKSVSASELHWENRFADLSHLGGYSTAIEPDGGGSLPMGKFPTRVKFSMRTRSLRLLHLHSSTRQWRRTRLHPTSLRVAALQSSMEGVSVRAHGSTIAAPPPPSSLCNCLLISDRGRPLQAACAHLLCARRRINFDALESGSSRYKSPSLGEVDSPALSLQHTSFDTK